MWPQLEPALKTIADPPERDRWARLRFLVIGPLMAAPPEPRQLGAAFLALAAYLHRLRGLIGAMAAALGGLDTLVFTGGVGENSAEIRAQAAAGLAFLGVALDEQRNAGARRCTGGRAART